MFAAFVSVWTALVEFLVGLFEDITPIFWIAATTTGGAGSLTFIGTLAVIMAGVALLLLVFNLIRSFFAMRG